MYLWRKSASQKWWEANEPRLRSVAGASLAIIERPDHKRLQLEIGSRSREQLQDIAKKFGGRVQKLQHDWLKRALTKKTKPIRVGTKQLIIPAGAAFGTGEHATTAMCLRLLEKLTRGWDRHWSMVDLGTGSGILALAAKFLGAKNVIGIDNDPVAIRTSKENARLNKLREIEFRVSDVRRCKMPAKIDVVTANLFSDVLITIAPKLARASWLILSGILREQEHEIRRALGRNEIEIIEVHRRGKWVAMLARRR